MRIPLTQSSLTLSAVAVLATFLPLPGASQTLPMGPETLVSVNQDGGALRVEAAAAVSGDRIIVAWNDSHGGREFGVRTGVSLAWAVSEDGGGSFAFGGYLPRDPAGRLEGAADAWLVTGPDGTIFLQALNWRDEDQRILVYSMAPEEESWSGPAVAVAAPKVDKPAMAVGAGGHALVYVADSRIRTTLSVDGGVTWGNAAELSGPAPRLRQGPSIALCGGGATAAWMEGDGLELTELWAAHSADGGLAWGEPFLLSRAERSVAPPPGYALGVGPASFIGNGAWLACGTDATGEPELHLAYAEGVPGGSVVKYRRAGFGGQGPIWEEPRALAGAPGRHRVFPSVTVMQGRPYILFYGVGHEREDEAHTYLAWGGEGSEFMFQRVSTEATFWESTAGDADHAPVQRNLGDYITLANGVAFLTAVWTDGRSGLPRILARRITLEAG